MPLETGRARVNEGAAEVVRWMLSEGRYNVRMREFGDEMSGVS